MAEKKKKKLNPKLTKQATTQSQQCVSDCLIKLKQAQKAVRQVNGLEEKLRCLLNSIKQRVGAIGRNGT